MNSSARDPSGILSRVPELENLIHDPKIKAPVERGDLNALYVALAWASRRAEHAANRALIEQLLSQRRLFLQPAKAPNLTTMNGVGSKIYGESEKGPDGSYIATQFLVFAFIPVFPLTAYLVKKADRGWYFFGKVPFSTFTYLWNRFLVAGMLAAILIGAGITFAARQHHEVWFVNGLGSPVHVAVGKKQLDVPAYGKSSVTLDNGQHPVEVTLGGSTIDQGTFEVERGVDAQVWNVAGIGNVYSVVYHYSSPPQEPSEEVRYCGQQQIKMGSVDDVFTEPPKSMSVSHGGSASRRVLSVAAETEQPACVNGLIDAQKYDQAFAMAKLVMRATHRADDFMWFASVADLMGKDAEAKAVLAELISKPDASITALRAYSSVREELGEKEAMRAEAKVAWAAAKEDPVRAYLYARLLNDDEGLAVMRPLILKPEIRQPDLLRLVGVLELRKFNADAAVTAFARLKAIDHKAWLSVFEEHLAALALAQKQSDALALLDKEWEALPPSDFLGGAEIYAWAQDLAQKGDPHALLRKRVAATEMNDSSFDALSWRDAPDAKLPTVVHDEAWMHAAHWNPSAVFDHPELLLRNRFGAPPLAMICLLVGEAHRLKKPALMETLKGKRPDLARRAAPMLAYLDTGVLPTDDSIPDSCRAPALVVRLRMGNVSAKEKAELPGLIAKIDPLKSYATRALHDWPAP